MKQTQNYQLNQWEKTDRIKMEDFNEDNRKIDAALGALAGTLADKPSRSEMAEALPWVKLGETTLSTAATEMSITVPNADQYQQFLVFYTAAGGKITYLTVQGKDTFALYNFSGTSTAPASKAAGRAELYPMDDGTFVTYSIYGTNSSTTQRYNDCMLSTGLMLSGNVSFALREIQSQLAAGTKLVVYGLKK